MNCWQPREDKSESWNFYRDPVIGGPPYFHDSYQQKIYQVLTVEIREESSHASDGERGKEPFWNTPEHSVLNKTCLQEKLIYQSLICWVSNLSLNLPGRREIPNPSQPLLAILSCSGGKVGRDWETLLKFTVQGHRLTERLRANRRTRECFPSPPPHHRIY